MNICTVCLEACNGSENETSINEWQTFNIEKIIEKHLWFWSYKSDSTSKCICKHCWADLWSFHTFYLRVESNHNSFYIQLNKSLALNSTATEVADDEEKPNIIETLEQNGNQDIATMTPLTEDLITLTKRKRGRPRNNELQCITLEELCVVEVKNEAIDYSDSSDHEKSFANVSLDNLHTTSNDFDDDYKSCDSSVSKIASEDETKDKVVKRKRRPKINRVITKTQKNTDGTSSVQLTKKYDDFISQNHELFCSLCHVPISDFQALINHFRNMHSSSRAFAMCCGKKFYKRAVFVDHLYVHKDPDYFKCKTCDKVFSNRRCLKNHLEWHDDSRKAKFNCAECGKDFFKRGSLEKHKLLHVPEDERQFQCTECEKKFASESLRTQHLKVTHLNKYAKICDICGKPFREKHSFQRHLAEHTGIPTAPIQCDLCGMKLTSTYGLNRHKRLRHTEENMQEQTCPYCSKISPNIAAHRSHIQYSHTMQRKHACHLCEKAFRRPKELKEHLSTHTGEALYTCPHCPRTFISNANMHKHRKNEHPIEWEEARSKRLSSYKIAAVDEANVETVF